MAIEKSISSGTTPMLLLKLLQNHDMYGYELIESLTAQSEGAFELKAGTLYPLLHSLENKGCLVNYEREVNGKVRKYYHLTETGKTFLADKIAEWQFYVYSVKGIINQLTIQEQNGFQINQIPWCSSMDEVGRLLGIILDTRPYKQSDDGGFVIAIKNPELTFYGFKCREMQLEFKNNGLVMFMFDFCTDDYEQTFLHLGDLLVSRFGDPNTDHLHTISDTMFHVKQWVKPYLDPDSYSILQLSWFGKWVNLSIKII